MCSGTEDVLKIKQEMLLNVGLVKKRSCDFDWTYEVKNDPNSSEEFSEDEDISILWSRIKSNLKTILLSHSISI